MASITLDWYVEPYIETYRETLLSMKKFEKTLKFVSILSDRPKKLFKPAFHFSGSHAPNTRFFRCIPFPLSLFPSLSQFSPSFVFSPLSFPSIFSLFSTLSFPSPLSKTSSIKNTLFYLKFTEDFFFSLSF